MNRVSGEGRRVPKRPAEKGPGFDRHMRLSLASSFGCFSKGEPFKRACPFQASCAGWSAGAPWHRGP